jgi:hypothetical protein
VLNKTLLLSRNDLQILLNESQAAEQRLQEASSELGDVLLLLEEKKEELREVVDRKAEAQEAIANSERRNRVGDDRATVEVSAVWGGSCHEVEREERQGSKEGLRGEKGRGDSEGGETGDKQRRLEAADTLRALQQAVSEEEYRFQTLQSLGEDRARSLKRKCAQSIFYFLVFTIDDSFSPLLLAIHFRLHY